MTRINDDRPPYETHGATLKAHPQVRTEISQNLSNWTSQPPKIKARVRFINPASHHSMANS
jgi:hypothetical protein